MPILTTQGVSLYYETHGDPSMPGVLLITGLGGRGASWDKQINHFANRYYVVVPDHRGTGQSTHTLEGHTTEQLATDMASVVEHLALGPMHVVGASTGGAIGQHMALNHLGTVRSLILSSTFARFDEFTRREFAARRKMAAEWDAKSLYSAYALFLFSPRYIRENPQKIAAWIERAASNFGRPTDREIALKRIDMILAHDTLAQLGEIKMPTLILCGSHNFCTPLPLSEELSLGIPNATLKVFEGAGELIDIERELEFFEAVSTFIDRQT